MNSFDIEREFMIYIKSKKFKGKIMLDEHPLVFADNEFEVNYDNTSIKLPNNGWVQLTGLPPQEDKIDWVAYFPETNNIIFGKGNPYDNKTNGFPTTKKIAIPYFSRTKFEEFMEVDES